MGEKEGFRTPLSPNGVITEPGVEGEMMIKLPSGQQLNYVYFNNPKKTKDSMTEDGFYKTGWGERAQNKLIGQLTMKSF